MADPFLLAHRVEPLLFDISGRAPISIRDQILRGHYLIRALHRTGVVGPGVRLLIVGAGAAGASAAIEAVKRGVTTVVVDAKPGPFLLQASCTTRWIDPAQYDFVAPHWARQVWPAPGVSGNIPLAFKADWATSIARTWENTLTSVALKQQNLLSLRYGWALAQWPVAQYSSPQQVRHYDVTLGKGPPLRGAPFASAYSVFSWEQFDVVVLAYGVEADRVVVADPPPGGNTPHYGPTPSVFKGLRFWDNDAFEQPGLGLGPGTRALVSGGGDGALQDFIRLATGQRSAREVVAALTASLPPTSLPEVELALWHQDEQAHRALLWTVPKDAPTYHAVQIAGVLNSMRAGRNANIELAYPCEHGYGYMRARMLGACSRRRPANRCVLQHPLGGRLRCSPTIVPWDCCPPRCELAGGARGASNVARLPATSQSAVAATVVTLQVNTLRVRVRLSHREPL